MYNKYRLSATVFDRKKEEDKIEPQKIYILSVEGNNTEKEYIRLRYLGQEKLIEEIPDNFIEKYGIDFKKNYMPFVDTAIQRAKEYESSEEELVNHIECNIWKLLESMRNY